MNPEETNNNYNDSNLLSTEEITSQMFSRPVNNNEPPKKNKKWKKILIVASLIIVAIPILGYFLLVIGFSGGIDGVISNVKPAPNPENFSIIAKRNVAKDSISKSFIELEHKMGFTNYATSSHDRCYKGQNNWKVKDGYAHRCDYRITKYYGFSGDFRQEMLGFDQKLLSIGWSHTDNGLTMSKMFVNYYDVNYGPDKSRPRNFPEGYLVSSLPTPGYRKDNQRMELEFAERDTKDLFGIEYAQEVSGDTLFETYENKKFQDVKALFRQITKDNRFVIVTSLQENYFQN